MSAGDDGGRTGATELARPRLREHPLLVALCVVPVLVEAGLLVWAGLTPSVPLAPQVAAPAPFGVFHDLRWLLVYHRSWTGFGLELAGLLAFRTAYTAATVWAAWPRHRPRPAVGPLVRRCLFLTVATGVILAPFATLLFGMAVVSVSYFFFAALPAVVVVALLVPHGPTEPWWRHRPPWRAVGWAGVSFAVLTIAGGVLAVVPGWAAPAVAAAAGLFDAWAWLGVVRVVALRERRARFIPVAPVGIAVALALVAVGTTITVKLGAASRAAQRRPVPPVAAPGGQPVLTISGFGQGWTGGPPPLQLGPGFAETAFSYRGLGSRGQPLPYTGGDTHQPIPQLVALFGRELSTLARRTGQPVDVVAESEGALIAQSYLAAHPGSPVGSVVLLSPLVEPARVYFPPPNRDGWGVAAGWALRALGRSIAAVTPVDLSPDGGLIRSIDDHATALRGLLDCPVPGVRELAMFPLADAVGAPVSQTVGVPTAVWPAFHGRLLSSASVGHVIALYLTTGRVPGYPTRSFTERLLRASAAAWQVPVLRLDLNPVWRVSVRSCQARMTALRRWLN